MARTHIARRFRSNLEKSQLVATLESQKALLQELKQEYQELKTGVPHANVASPSHAGGPPRTPIPVETQELLEAFWTSREDDVSNMTQQLEACVKPQTLETVVQLRDQVMKVEKEVDALCGKIAMLSSRHEVCLCS